MFEIEKMEKEFDYSLLDNETADFLRSCEYEMNGIAEDARLKFGRVLKNVQEKLSNYHDGVFVKWYESGGLDKNDVYYSINLYEISRNLENSKKDNFLNAPKTLQKEVMKKNAPEELKNKVFDGDITTNKEYQEMKRKLEESEQQKEQAEKQAKKARQSEQIALDKLEKEQAKEPKVVEKEVIKEIDNTDYEQINHLNKQVKRKERSYELLKAEKEALEYKMRLLEEENEEFSDFKEKFQSITSKKNELSSQISAVTSISGLVIEIDDLLKNKLAPVKYSSAIQEVSDNEIVIENLSTIINAVQLWCDEMKGFLPAKKSSRNIIEMGEITNG